jgi:hypothetical protein
MAAGFPTPACTFFPLARGNMVDMAAAAFGVARLPTDPVGTFTLTLTNLVVGSAVQVETLAGAAVENRTASSGTEVFALSAYASGNPANNLRIKVRKGSAAPFYQPWETLATATPGSASIYVSQIPDE